MLVWTLDFEKLSEKAPLQLRVNFGGVIAQKKSSSVLTAAIALVCTPAAPFITLLKLLANRGSGFIPTISTKQAVNNDPLWLSPGIRLNLPRGFYATLAGDIGLSDDRDDARTNWVRGGYAYSTKAVPKYGAQVSFGWKMILHEDDRDGDGLIDKKDGPLEAEDRDDFADDDGCPDPDNDNDGYPDAQDRCPDSAGTDGGVPGVRRRRRRA